MLYSAHIVAVAPKPYWNYVALWLNFCTEFEVTEQYQVVTKRYSSKFFLTQVRGNYGVAVKPRGMEESGL